MTTAAAVHWEAAGCLVEPQRLQRRLSWACNVRLHDILRRKGTALIDTLGLAALGLVDGQCGFRGLDAADMARWMYSLGRQIFTNGDVAGDGKRIPGLRPDEQWECRLKTAIIPPVRPVIDVRPSAPHAARL